jgi:excisionase family DNA binding protein
MSRNAKVSLPPEADDFMSTADAAKLLFVSRPHVVKLLEEGKLTLHHAAAKNVFLTRASVLAYRAHQRAAAETYQASTGDNE